MPGGGSSGHVGEEQLSVLHPGCLPTPSGPRGIGGPAHLTMVSFGIEASPPLEDQSFRLAPCTTTPDDEGTAATDGSELSSGVPTMCKGSEKLLALVLRLPSGPGGVAGGKCRSPCGVIRGGFMVVSRRWTIPSRS